MKTIVLPGVLSLLICSALAFGQAAGNRAGANPTQNPAQGDGSGSRRYPTGYGNTSAAENAIEQPNDAFQPYDAYSSFKAFETGGVDDNYRVVERRKSSTLYFDPLDPGKFDAVLTPIGFEPQVQCAYYVRVRYQAASHSTVTMRSDGMRP